MTSAIGCCIPLPTTEQLKKPRNLSPYSQYTERTTNSGDGQDKLTSKQAEVCNELHYTAFKPTSCSLARDNTKHDSLPHL